MPTCHAPTAPVAPAWHRDLAAALPLIRARAARADRRLDPDARDEAAAEVAARVAADYARLVERRKAHPGLIPPLVKFALRQRAAGRRVGSPTNRRDALSPVPRPDRRVVSLESASPGGLTWRDALPDSRQADPAELAAARIDVGAWLASLPPSLRRVADAFVRGDRTGEVAARLGVSPGRVSQLRAELRDRWADFAGESLRTADGSRAP